MIKQELKIFLMELNKLDYVRNSRIFQKFVKINKEYLDLWYLVKVEMKWYFHNIIFFPTLNSILLFNLNFTLLLYSLFSFTNLFLFLFNQPLVASFSKDLTLASYFFAFYCNFFTVSSLTLFILIFKRFSPSFFFIYSFSTLLWAVIIVISRIDYFFLFRDSCRRVATNETWFWCFCWIWYF